MKSSSLSSEIINEMYKKYCVTVENGSELVKILELVDNHVIDLIDRKITNAIARVTPTIIEAVKMDLTEDIGKIVDTRLKNKINNIVNNLGDNNDKS